ncbi:unnamed protein product [Chironomus riparius]|uniref:Uncharacterized protein n=1 Tax=Chironomus riparius TaxID=315576 RepID=A0A9N9RYR0_9DIPT|nr:unnamed protein product [Chironomus riparius]
MGEKDKFRREEEDDDELLEFISLLLLVIIPIVLIYGLCVYCFKQKQIGLRKRKIRKNEVCTRMATHQPSTNDLLRVYTVPLEPDSSNNSHVIENNVNHRSCPTCSCRQNESSSINNDPSLPESEEHHESPDPTLPSYSQVLSKSPPNFYTIPN